MAFNPKKLIQAKGRLEIFQQDHPKLVPFFQMLQQEQAVAEGSVFELKVTTPDGTEYKANIKLTANDIETIRLFSE